MEWRAVARKRDCKGHMSGISQLVVQYTEEVLAYDFLDLVNGLGGLLGLFLGYSVLSLMEYCRHTVHIRTECVVRSYFFYPSF